MNERSVDDYLALSYHIVVQSDPTGGFVAYVQEWPGCMTQAETWAELGLLIADAMASWCEAGLDAGESIPVPTEGTGWS